MKSARGIGTGDFGGFAGQGTRSKETPGLPLRHGRKKGRAGSPHGIPWRGVACIRGCAACQTRGPLRTSTASQGARRMGAPFHRKIRPPGASRRRATDNHVTLLPYRYQSRRHNTARPTVPPPLSAACHGPTGEKRRVEKRKKEGEGEGKESSLYFSYEPVRYLPSSVHSAFAGPRLFPCVSLSLSSDRGRELAIGC